MNPIARTLTPSAVTIVAHNPTQQPVSGPIPTRRRR
jgi:hypothetical protein